MPTGVFDSILLKHIWGTDELRAIFNDEMRVQKWYDYEAALALSQAELGIIPQAAADEIAVKAKVANVDLEKIGEGVRHVKHPLVPALRELQAVCAGDHGEYLHFGPDHAGRARYRHDAAAQAGPCGVVARLEDNRPRTLSPRRNAQVHANDRSQPRRAGVADHFRPQGCGLARRDRSQP